MIVKWKQEHWLIASGRCAISNSTGGLVSSNTGFRVLLSSRYSSTFTRSARFRSLRFSVWNTSYCLRIGNSLLCHGLQIRRTVHSQLEQWSLAYLHKLRSLHLSSVIWSFDVFLLYRRKAEAFQQGCLKRKNTFIQQFWITWNVSCNLHDFQRLHASNDSNDRTENSTFITVSDCVRIRRFWVETPITWTLGTVVVHGQLAVPSESTATD